MLHRLSLIVLLCASLQVSAQKEPLLTPYAIPVDTVTNLITYEEVVEVKGVQAAMLYKRMHEWFLSFYKNPSEVIRENDSVKFSIMGKPRFRLLNPPNKDGVRNEGTVVQYTITVAARGGRFKYTLSEFNWKQTSYYPCERWLDTKATSYLPVYNDYLQQLDKTAVEVVRSLKEAVTKENQKKDKDNW